MRMNLRTTGLVTLMTVAGFIGARPLSAEDPHPTVDGHNHEAVTVSDGRLDVTGIARLRELGIDVALIPLPLDRSETVDIELRLVNEVRGLRTEAARNPEITIGSPDVEFDTPGRDAVVLMFAVEWFRGLFDGDIGRVQRFRDLGIRVISLVETDPDGLFVTGDGGAQLSPFGVRIVSAMNASGVLIDITHLSHSQKLEVIRRSSRPVVATHSLVADVSPSGFNLPREVVDALARTGGSVWVSFNSSDLRADHTERDPVELVADHVVSLIAHLGSSNVGIGTDLQAGGAYVPAALNEDGVLQRIERVLLERGLSRGVVDGVLGLNVLRTLAAGGYRDESH